MLRAIHQWIVDNDCTPHVVFDAHHPDVRVPPGCDEDGRVTLNVSASAVRDLVMDDETISFSARFGGRVAAVSVPVEAVLAIYARENLQGALLADDEPVFVLKTPPQRNKPRQKSKPRLRLVE